MRMNNSQTRTSLNKLAVIKREVVWVGRLRVNGTVDERTKLRQSPYHTQLLKRMTPRKLFTQLAREGYQVEIRR